MQNARPLRRKAIINRALCKTPLLDFYFMRKFSLSLFAALLSLSCCFAEKRPVDYVNPFIGTTHYPLLTDIIREIMGPEVSLVNAGAESVHTLHDALARRQLLAPEGTGQALLCTSDRPEGFGQMARRFLQEEPTAPVRLVDIERY